MSAIKNFVTINTRKMAVNEYLRKELNAAGYSGVDIRKTPTRTIVTIRASRPGVVIGRRGTKIREITEVLEKQFGVENPQVEVAEIENPWLDAQVMASRLARQLERGIRFRKTAYWILKKVMRAGALGCEIIVKGKISSARARYQKFREGTIGKSGEPAVKYVTVAHDYAVLKAGTIGVTVKIMWPNARLPDKIIIYPPKDREVKKPQLVKPREEVSEEVPEEKAEETFEEDISLTEQELEEIGDLEELEELENLDEALDETADSQGSNESEGE